MEESSLIQQAQAGDTQAFRALIERYHTPAWQTAQVLLRDRTAIEDVMQEAWRDVWRGLPGFQRERPFRPWLLTIVANRCHMTTRRRRFSWQLLENAQAEEIFASDDVVAEVLRQESDSELQAALQHISEDQKRVLELRFFADLDKMVERNSQTLEITATFDPAITQPGVVINGDLFYWQSVGKAFSRPRPTRSSDGARQQVNN